MKSVPKKLLKLDCGVSNGDFALFSETLCGVTIFCTEVGRSAEVYMDHESVERLIEFLQGLKQK